MARMLDETMDLHVLLSIVPSENRRREMLGAEDDLQQSGSVSFCSAPGAGLTDAPGGRARNAPGGRQLAQ